MQNNNTDDVQPGRPLRRANVADNSQLLPPPVFSPRRYTCTVTAPPPQKKNKNIKQTTREKIVVVSGTEEQQRETLLGYMSAEALEGGRLGCPGAPAFDVDGYLKGGDAGGVRENQAEPEDR